MRIAVLGATGQTGRQLVIQSLERGHTVVALARSPEKLADIKTPGLEVARANVFEPDTVRAAAHGVDALVSGLGVTDGDSGTLQAGARAVRDAGIQRVVWLGALGTGVTRGAAGPLIDVLMSLFMRKRLPDKVLADELARSSGASVVHAGALTNDRGLGGGRLVPVTQVPRRLLPPSIARADLAALMLDEATNPRFQGTTAVALAGP
ncbi:NAD(P)-dependent oxidoreductase [Hyalangium versicolor]|uniref:NAD(P)-dependent oxidoreductase n=1 Tax=Hyalangium versicolor TaxID=2861190 RepID=UPI001CCCEC66|nr:NAD(P)-binding oxidoreductase [Hyalangium versicolor]